MKHNSTENYDDLDAITQKLTLATDRYLDNPYKHEIHDRAILSILADVIKMLAKYNDTLTSHDNTLNASEQRRNVAKQVMESFTERKFDDENELGF